MEYLHRTLQNLRHNPQFHYHPRCAKLGLINICLADYLLMSCKADASFIHILFNTFQHFSTVLGIQANMDKSSLYTAGVTDEFWDQMLADLHLIQVDLPFKYLGVPRSTRKLYIYWAQIFLLPQKIISMVTTVCRTFLWTGSNNYSRKALIAWENICKPKIAGGLNVIDILRWNKAAIC
ncbi:uncharacterized protein LOC132612032 [Lycium barbarum]|uniref:uncharacterized protein LOC132612032 n=1 Tax=Lycium barbarum TaxID=112863 RepID=UPI00293E57FE|nr:uncharacterized protein LOC132612032 [Lycium barbarum]